MRPYPELLNFEKACEASFFKIHLGFEKVQSAVIEFK